MVFKKGNKPWNLGLTKEKDSRVKRNAENSSKTKKESGKYKGKNNPMFGVHRMGRNSPHYNKPHNDKTKEKISIKAKKRFKDKTKHPSFGKKRLDLSKRNWRGGVTPINQLIRHSQEYKLWRKAVFERDNYTCRFCGQVGGTLNADHIKSFALYPELRFAIDNGRTLCIDCHKKTSSYLNKGKMKWR